MRDERVEKNYTERSLLYMKYKDLVANFEEGREKLFETLFNESWDLIDLICDTEEDQEDQYNVVVYDTIRYPPDGSRKNIVV